MRIEQGTRALVTGAASGIGRATAQALGKLGCRLFLTDINAPGLEETARGVSAGGGEVLLQRALDISDLASVRALADDVHRNGGPLDILVNVAGIALFALVEDMEHRHWEKVLGVNLWGPIHGIECFLPEMIRAKRGHVVTVSSVAGLTGAPWHAAYAASKWACVGLSEVLRYDLRQHHIAVTVVCPGAVETPLKDTVEILGVNMESEVVRALKRKFTQHAVTPERVAELIVRAIERDRFLVLTSFDVKIVYFLKRFCFPLYHRVMMHISGLLNATKTP